MTSAFRSIITRGSALPMLELETEPSLNSPATPASPVKAMDLDFFSRLPLELKLEILSYIPDLVSLYRIVCASQSLQVAFKSCPAKIVGSIRAGLPGELRDLVDETLSTLSNLTLARRNSNCLNGMIDIAKYDFCVTGEDTGIDNGFPLNATSRIVHWLLLIACRIETVAEAFLSSHLDRTNSIEVEHVADPAFYFPWESPTRNFYYPKGRPFIPETWATVSYIESFWVVTTVWRVQLQSLRFPERSDGKAKSSQPDSKYDLNLESGLDRFEWEEDQVECVQDYLDAESIQLNDIALEALQGALRESRFYSRRPANLPLLSEPPRDEYSRAWHQGLEHTTSKPSAVHWFLIQSHPTRGYNTLMRNVDWEPFRRLGFGFWDAKRMCALGLLNNGEAKSRPQHDQQPWRKGRLGVGLDMTIGQTSFAWRSIRLGGERLSPDPDNEKYANNLLRRWGSVSPKFAP